MCAHLKSSTAAVHRNQGDGYHNFSSRAITETTHFGKVLNHTSCSMK